MNLTVGPKLYSKPVNNINVDKTSTQSFGINFAKFDKFVEKHNDYAVDMVHVMEAVLERHAPSAIKKDPFAPLGWHVVIEKMTGKKGVKSVSCDEIPAALDGCVKHLMKKYPFLATIKDNYNNDNIKLKLKWLQLNGKDPDKDPGYINWWKRQLKNVPDKILVKDFPGEPNDKLGESINRIWQIFKNQAR